MYIQSHTVTLQTVSPGGGTERLSHIGPLGEAGLPGVKAGGGKGIPVAGGIRWKSEKGTENLEGLTIRYDGLLSHCNRAKILIKLCILTVIAEHFCVFECMRVLLPVCMRSCVCTDVSFFFSTCSVHLYWTYSTHP